MAKKWFLFGLIWVFSSIVAFGGTNYRISELDALRRLPFEVREKDDNITVPEFDLRAEEYALIVSSLPEELYELQKVDVEIGNSWELFVVGKEKDKEKVILKNLASTFHYLDKESRQTNSFVLAGEQKLVALITESGDMAKLSKFKEKRFFLACHDGGNIFYPRNETIVWEFREMNNVNQKNFQPKGAPFEDGINGISYIKRGSDTDQKIEKLIYSVANSSELGYRGTVLPREDYEEIERTFFEKASGMLKKELINSVPFLSFGLRYGNFRVSKFISSSSLNVANAFVENGSQRQATGLNIYCDNQIAQRVFYRNVTELKRANSIIAQEIFTLKQETARQSNQLAQRQKEAEKLESEIILMGSALAKQERQNQEREFALTEVLRATRGDAERLREENNQFKQQLLAESAMVTNLLEEKTIQSVELAEIKKEFVKIKNSTAIFKARLDKIEEGNKAKDNLLFVNLIRQEKKEQKEIRIAKAGLGFSNYEQNERIPLVSIFGALFLVAFFAINHRGKNRRDRCKRAIMREPKTRAKVRKKFKKEQKPKQKTKRRRKMRKNFFIALFFISVLNFSSLPTAMAQNKDIASKLEVYTPKDNPELFNRLAGQNPELYIEVLKNPKQVIMEVKGVFRPYILASGVKVLADKDGNIKFAQCGNSVIDPGDNKSMSESNEPKNKTDKESKERESLRQDFFLGMYFEQMGTFQKGQQILQARQLLQQEKILEFLTESQRAQQAQSQIIQSQNQNQKTKERFIWWRDGVNVANLGLNIADLVVDVRNGGGKKSSNAIFNLTQSLSNVGNPILNNKNDANITNNPVVDLISVLNGGNNTAQGGSSNAQGGNAYGGNSAANAQGGDSVANANNDNNVSNSNPINVTSNNTNGNSASNDNKNSNTGTNSNTNSNQQNQGQAQNQTSNNANVGSGGVGSPQPTPIPPSNPPSDPVVNVGNGNTNNTHNSGDDN